MRNNWRDEPSTEGQRIFLYEHSNMKQEAIRKLTRGEASDIIDKIKREWLKSGEENDRLGGRKEKL